MQIHALLRGGVRLVIKPKIAVLTANLEGRGHRLLGTVAVAGALMTLCSICLLGSQPSAGAEPTLGLPPLPIPADSPQTPEKVALGRTLFLDSRLSADGTVSCSTCHQPERAFADGRAVAQGIQHRTGTRNTPSLINSAYQTSLFWDGRRESLEEQAEAPWINPVEHGLGSHEELLRLVKTDAAYRRDFRAAFGLAPESIGLEHVVKALAAFERTLVVGDSAFDRYRYGGDSGALSEAQIRGLAVFEGRARCTTCHTIGEKYALLTDHSFHPLGIERQSGQSRLADRVMGLMGMTPSEADQRITGDPEIASLGRFAVTREPRDIGRFRTPSLRNVALTAPYMHDGSVPTLREAVEREVYYRGLEANRPLVLTPQERQDLVAFLEALTSATQPLPSSR